MVGGRNLTPILLNFYFKNLLMAGFNAFLSKCRKKFAAGENNRSEKFYRIANKLPTLLMVAIVFLAVLKPF
jgi:putative membrane protein